MVERQLRCDLLRLILVAGWFVPFWRDTDRLRAGNSRARAFVSVAGERRRLAVSSLSLLSACAAARG